MKKSLVITITVLIAAVISAGAFYGGLRYGQSKRPQAQALEPALPDFRNLSPEDRSRLRESIASGRNFIGGEIIARDESSITIKLRNGGSRIVFFSDSTEITKSVTGSQSDLQVGKTVIVTGDLNQDGSVTARSIQVR